MSQTLHLFFCHRFVLIQNRHVCWLHSLHMRACIFIMYLTTYTCSQWFPDSVEFVYKFWSIPQAHCLPATVTYCRRRTTKVDTLLHSHFYDRRPSSSCWCEAHTQPQTFQCHIKTARVTPRTFFIMKPRKSHRSTDISISTPSTFARLAHINSALLSAAHSIKSTTTTTTAQRPRVYDKHTHTQLYERGVFFCSRNP